MQKDVVLEKKKQSRSPITWVPTAYFAMGLPFVVLNMVTVLMFEGLGVDKTLITFWTSLILLPYTLKPLWSPFLELFKTKKFWVVLTQMVSGVTFGLVAFSLGLPNFFTIAIAPRRHRFQRRHARHRLRRRVYERAGRRAAGGLYRLAGRIL